MPKKNNRFHEIKDELEQYIKRNLTEEEKEFLNSDMVKTYYQKKIDIMGRKMFRKNKTKNK